MALTMPRPFTKAHSHRTRRACKYDLRTSDSAQMQRQCLLVASTLIGPRGGLTYQEGEALAHRLTLYPGTITCLSNTRCVRDDVLCRYVGSKWTQRMCGALNPSPVPVTPTTRELRRVAARLLSAAIWHTRQSRAATRSTLTTPHPECT